MADTLGSLLLDGLSTELDYMSDEQASAARELEEELTLDALAGVDLRIRLIGFQVSL